MLRCVSARCRMRVLCLTMVFDGGAMTLALKRLGYVPYTLRSSLQKGNAARHPLEWSLLLDDKQRVDMQLFSDYDAIVGPPAAIIYDRLLRECPDYTKVILVEEVDKEQWARDYETHVAPLLLTTRRRARHRIAKAFGSMIERMTPHDEAAGRVVALERYEARVRSSVPADRLLVYRHGDGWEPLCAFLDKKVPDALFPPYDNGMHVVGNLHERIERTVKLTYMLAAMACCSVAYALYPAMGALQDYAKELYRDYRTAYGTD